MPLPGRAGALEVRRAFRRGVVLTVVLGRRPGWVIFIRGVVRPWSSILTVASRSATSGAGSLCGNARTAFIRPLQGAFSPLRAAAARDRIILLPSVAVTRAGLYERSSSSLGWTPSLAGKASTCLSTTVCTNSSALFTILVRMFIFNRVDEDGIDNPASAATRAAKAVQQR